MPEVLPLDVLLAKSRVSAQDEAISVAEHCLEVADCAAAIIEAIGSELAAFFGLDDKDEAQLAPLLRVAALIHDLGKAGASFQAQMHEGERQRHPFWHEWLSVAVCMDPAGLGSWIRRALPEPRGRTAVLTAVMGHHVRTSPSSVPKAREPRDEVVYLDHASLSSLWQQLAIHAPGEATPEPERRGLTKVEWEDLLCAYFLFVQDAVRDQPQPGREHLVSLAACCKAALVAADTVASARISGQDTAAGWAKTVLRRGLRSDELDRIVDARLGGRPPYPFQERVAASDERVTLVEAGCGNGKTLAAYMWARRSAVGRRLVFCYPTTGTTSAGFQDYLLAQTELERRLMHGRASADIEHILDNGAACDRDSLWIADVLDLWGTKVVACTVDSVLSLLACWRRALAAAPVFAQSAFVFGEVHSYDDQLFGAFLAFLRWTRASCLVMTASLSDARRAAIERACGKPLQPIGGEPTMEDAARYGIARVHPEDVTEWVEEARKSGGKVLYVANTVARAVAAFNRLGTRWSPDARLYHSRFRYEDRVRVQGEVLELFRGRGPAFVAATQVCEMSLDISATLLISELAPFPALVQRLGRLNRRAREPEAACPALIVEPPDPRPYDKEALSLADRMVASLEGQSSSQRDLARALAGMPDGPYEDRIMPLLSPSDIAGTQPGMLRDGSVSMPVVREEDLPCSRNRITRAELVRLTIPMLPSQDHDVRLWHRLRGTLVAPAGSIDYDPIRGARWRN
ncbi:CRISPR-associated helicase Cas3' [Candidatus Palauibacter sp.]|uniref:CRISPR-associated helicase Cas3' n=1 Tax=Candidatus Palauibacter sp. TaxID=3101350 RepID=UPI003B526B6C